MPSVALVDVATPPRGRTLARNFFADVRRNGEGRRRRRANAMQSFRGQRIRDDANNRDTTASIAATGDMYIPSEPLAPETSMRRVATWLFLPLLSMPPLLA